MKRPHRDLPLERYRKELSRCVKCGSCCAVCPPFLQERRESMSARGRIALIRAVLDGRLMASDIYEDRLATCTGCLACEEACGSKVPVTGIIQAAMEQAMRESGPGFIDAVISGLVKNPVAFHAAAWFASKALHFSGGRGGGSTFKAQRSWASGAVDGRRETRGKVAFFPGCAVPHLQPELGRATVAVLDRLGYDVVVPEGFKCCGRPLLSMGDRKAAAECSEHNSGIFAGLEAEAIVTACASCGLTFKRDYPKLLPPGAKHPAVLDIHEFLATRLSNTPLARVKKRITWHDPCHLGRGQGLSSTARDILRAVPGLSLVEMKNPDACCGFGGVMRMTHPQLSDGIAGEKAKNIIATDADAIVTGCPGCYLQIREALRRKGSDIEVMHTVQVLEEALMNAELNKKEIGE